ncbi:MAG: hypothetical protein ACYCWW_15620 [Deltaproteobacteria bacterium]
MAVPTSQAPNPLPPWPIVITEWALDSYLNLLHAGTFSRAEYKNVIRPDVVLLRDGIPSPHPKFQQSTSSLEAGTFTGVLYDSVPDLP